MKTTKFNSAEAAANTSAPKELTDSEKREAIVKAKQTEIDAENAKRTGKGTRLHVGQTRGKNPQVITWEAFDESKADTLPASIAEFVELTKAPDEKTIVSYLVEGYNSSQYTAASDPIAEFVNPSWPDEVQKQFRIVVRNFASAASVSIEDAVALIKPGIEASQKR